MRSDFARKRMRAGYLMVLAVLIMLMGGVLIALGGWLAVLGGSWYYALMGAATLAAGVLLFRRNAYGVVLFGAASIATLGWGLWEAGFDGWALLPRLAWLAVVGLLLWPACKMLAGPVPQALQGLLTGGLAMLQVTVILIPLLHSPYVHLADSTRAQARPAQAFSRSTVPSPDGNIAGSHGAETWTAYAGSNLANHYAPSAQITPQNVSRLEKAWEFHTGDVKPQGSRLRYAFQNTPLKVGDMLYICTPTQKVIAIDARDGQARWRFDPHTSAKAMSTGVPVATCRGVSYFDAGNDVAECPRRIFWPMVDGRLGALDADTGTLCKSFGRNGYVDLNQDTGNDRPGFVGPTSPPVVMRGVVIQPTGQIRDSQQRDAPSGVVRAFDAVTGELRWAWDLGRPQTAARPPEGQVYTRSTPNVWAPMAADDELGLVYLPTGNAAGDFFGAERTPAEEDYTASLVALDAQTGKERWHFRTVNHDLWDYDLGPQPNLIDFPVGDGQSRAAVIQATKSGQVFVLDRATGEPILPVEQIDVPQGTDSGDHTAATQPVSPDMPNTLGAPGASRERLEERDAWGITPFDQMLCRIQFRQMRYEGYYTPPSQQGSLVFPGNNGGVNWGGVAVDPQRGLMIVNNSRLPYTETLYPRKRMEEMGVVSVFQGASRTKGYLAQAGLAFGARKSPWMSPLDVPCIAPPWGFLSGIDLRTRQVVWSRPLGTGEDQGPMGLASHVRLEMGTPNNSGALLTGGGLTFIGAALDNYLRAFDSQTGELLWQMRLPAGPQAAPMSYEVEGRQYIVAAVGGHESMKTTTGDSVIAWALPDK